MRHHQRVLGELAAHVCVHGLELRPGRGDLHRVRERSQAKCRRLSKADAVAVGEPATRRPFSQRTRRRSRADGRGARGVLVRFFGFAFEDQKQRRATEHVAFQRFDRAL